MSNSNSINGLFDWWLILHTFSVCMRNALFLSLFLRGFLLFQFSFSFIHNKNGIIIVIPRPEIGRYTFSPMLAIDRRAHLSSAWMNSCARAHILYIFSFWFPCISPLWRQYLFSFVFLWFCFDFEFKFFLRWEIGDIFSFCSVRWPHHIEKEIVNLSI